MNIHEICQEFCRVGALLMNNMVEVGNGVPCFIAEDAMYQAFGSTVDKGYFGNDQTEIPLEELKDLYTAVSEFNDEYMIKEFEEPLIHLKEYIEQKEQ